MGKNRKIIQNNNGSSVQETNGNLNKFIEKIEEKINKDELKTKLDTIKDDPVEIENPEKQDLLNIYNLKILLYKSKAE
ncbi:MAG: hypothetical protein GY823_01715 [Flavobacteriaceae bacterium]|nr:hypothetical protein [Flavobacteriaceae bacterium]